MYIFDGILQKFTYQAPASVMRGLLEHLLNAERLDAWFETTHQRQYKQRTAVHFSGGVDADNFGDS